MGYKETIKHLETMKNLLVKIHLFFVSIMKVKFNVQILSIIMFFFTCFALYYNRIYAGIFYFLFTLLYILILEVVPQETWKISKKEHRKGTKNLLIFLSSISFFILLFVLTVLLPD